VYIFVSFAEMIIKKKRKRNLYKLGKKTMKMIQLSKWKDDDDGFELRSDMFFTITN
jgi:hypothetical protein